MADPDPRQPEPLDRLLTLKQVAAQLDLSERHLQRMVRDGRFFAPVRPGNSPRWYQRDVDSYLHALARGMALQGPPQPQTPAPKSDRA